MPDSVYLGNKVMSFTKKPRMKPYDMVIINVSDDEVITSPRVSINKETWVSKGFENGIYEIEYNGSEWIRVDTEEEFNLSEAGIVVTYSSATSAKIGDSITVEQLSNTTTSGGETKTEYTVNIELTRTGNVLETDNPFATQQIADNMLAKVIGYAYQPYNAGGAIIDPASELGDAITAYGVYGGIYSEELTYSRLMAPSIGAPGDAETQHEYDYVDSIDKKYRRQIGSKVSRTNGDGSSQFSWEIFDDHFLIRATVNGVVTPMLYIDKDGATFAGTVRANRIETGTIIVDGKPISAGYIQGSQIGSGTISGGNIGGGTITGGNVAGSTITTGNTTFGDTHAANIASVTATVNSLIAGGITASAIKATSGYFTYLGFGGYDLGFSGSNVIRVNY